MKGRGIRVVPQRKEWDCGIAALVMLTGRSYGDVAQVVREHVHDPRLKTRGLLLWHMEMVADLLGTSLRRVYRRAGYLDCATGILGVNGGMCDPAGHWVVMKNGALIDPSGGEVWAVPEYMKAGKCRPATLLVEDK